jgi:hypothetical protein
MDRFLPLDGPVSIWCVPTGTIQRDDDASACGTVPVCEVYMQHAAPLHE